MDWFVRPRVSTSRLHQLPAEIRTAIFEFALTSSKPVVTFRLDSFQRDSYSEASQPPLTRVSRQFRDESLPIFYQCNDFVLHTEGLDEYGGKAKDAKHWLRCIQPQLSKLCGVTFWLKYVTLTNDPLAQQGLLAVGMRWHAKRERWIVEENGWRWITVVRKPTVLASDAQYLTSQLRSLVEGKTREAMGSEDYLAVMRDLRLMYVKDKTT